MPLHPDFLRLPLAHRALHDRAKGRPENSRAAICAAVEAGYGIEIDLQLSCDGVPMVFHDYTLDRLTGHSGAVHAKTAAQLGATGLRDAQDGIPTLSQVLSLVDGKVPLLVELKDQDDPQGAGGGPLEQAAAQVLTQYGGPLAVMSFSPLAMARFHAAAPQIATGLTTCAYSAEHFPDMPAVLRSRLSQISDYNAIGGSFISHQWQDLDMARVHDLKARGAAILCWTIRTSEHAAQARQIADNITFEGFLA
ncbi:phosphodiesterase [Thioclava sp. SK-1]|uniref:glycerophosphodiester phosphodiesterase family protein n=1 Tax=Thioclava sp. SK-1 TaxID=1889770 RepID=UPI000824B474|nr:glycerophosphodiester phosphodiesterase family protein [Thioclava sp. SK-1]OCX65850.1 phosphodiesterase [Thioclava sp. SK-1]